MKSAGHYALLQANGMPLAELVKLIRDEQARYLRTPAGRNLAIECVDCDGGDFESVQWVVYTDAEEATSE